MSTPETVGDYLGVGLFFALYLLTLRTLWVGPRYEKETTTKFWSLAFAVMWSIDDYGGITSREVFKLRAQAHEDYGVYLLESPYEARSFPDVDPQEGLKDTVLIGEPAGKRKVTQRLTDGKLVLSCEGAELPRTQN